MTGIPQNYFFMIAETESHVTEPISRMEFMTFPENVEILNAVLNHQLVMLCAMTGESGHWQSTARSIAATLQENFLGLTVAVSNLYSRPEDFTSPIRSAAVRCCAMTSMEERRGWSLPTTWKATR